MCWLTWFAGNPVTVQRCLDASALFPFIDAKPKCVAVWQSVHNDAGGVPGCGGDRRPGAVPASARRA